METEEEGALFFYLNQIYEESSTMREEVPNEEEQEYCEFLQHFIQLDRGIKIPGAPVGCDFEIGDDYSMWKFEKQYGLL